MLIWLVSTRIFYTKLLNYEALAFEYPKLAEDYASHASVNHGAKEFVSGAVNYTAESFNAILELNTEEAGGYPHRPLRVVFECQITG